MDKWPNWVDLIVLSLLARGCIVGFGRGVMAELLFFLGAVCVTLLACNGSIALFHWVAPWWHNDPELLQVVAFWLVFLVGLLVVYRILRQLAAAVLREGLHPWPTQLLGLIIGAARSAWWTTLLLLFLLSLNSEYLVASIQQRSLAAPHLIRLVEPQIRRVVEVFPGHPQSHSALIPAAKIQWPKMPSLDDTTLTPTPSKRH